MKPLHSRFWSVAPCPQNLLGVLIYVTGLILFTEASPVKAEIPAPAPAAFLDCPECGGLSPSETRKELKKIHDNGRNLSLSELNRFNHAARVVCADQWKIFHNAIAAMTFIDDSDGELFRYQGAWATLYVFGNGPEYWWSNASPKYSKHLNDDKLDDLESARSGFERVSSWYRGDGTRLANAFSCDPNDQEGLRITQHPRKYSIGTPLPETSRRLNRWNFFFKYNPDEAGGVYTVKLQYDIFDRRVEPSWERDYTAYCYIQR